MLACVGGWTFLSRVWAFGGSMLVYACQTIVSPCTTATMRRKECARCRQDGVRKRHGDEGMMGQANRCRGQAGVSVGEVNMVCPVDSLGTKHLASAEPAPTAPLTAAYEHLGTCSVRTQVTAGSLSVSRVRAWHCSACILCWDAEEAHRLSLIHISEPTRPY